MLLLTLSVGAVRFALSARQIVQVLPRVALRPVLLTEPYVVGMLEWSGHVIPVVDLRIRWQGTPCNQQLGTRIIVVQRPQGTLLGLVAEHVTDVVEVDIPPISWETLPSVDGLGPTFHLQGKLVQWLHIDHIVPPYTLERLDEQLGANG